MDGFIEIIKTIHSIFRYGMLLMLVGTLINFFIKWRNNYAFDAKSNRLSLITFIFSHVQLLLGFMLYFMGPKGMSYFGMEGVMSNSMMRFFAVEHIFGMLVAIILISLGRIKSKKLESDVAKHKTTFIYFLIALVIIIVSIPWPFRGFGQAWF